MVRRRECAVSNHEAPLSASSFETPLARLLRMRVGLLLRPPADASIAEAERGEFASDDEVRAIWRQARAVKVRYTRRTAR